MNIARHSKLIITRRDQPSIERRFARYERRGRERDGKDAEFNPLTRVSDDRAR